MRCRTAAVEVSARFLRASAQRLRRAAVRVFLAAATAGGAWWLARLLLGQSAPIFAPIAAIVSLLDEPGVRGRRAFRLIGGVLIGVGVGELLLRLLGTGPWEIGVAVALEALLVSAFSTNPLPLIHAGIAAMLVSPCRDPSSGISRLLVP